MYPVGFILCSRQEIENIPCVFPFLIGSKKLKKYLKAAYYLRFFRTTGCVIKFVFQIRKSFDQKKSN
ncbi:MAG: hypothetical protein A2W90_10315 [Bacteroidetes bacterium GWF2_42_66]|nr:MAG: hypothetical protein A2W92_24010 [Bacteroidetes bacterium GWA2_42_15]OFY01516.1 MAG: hypothetical protein A2W89_02200 [Bacteroidetes bacterium GWE2_42_39]OFY43303.1 MAG: hypothetical protein A2W90_10315 [Bacteroidetes bacterium GWF2_42_66]HBL77514.1 hypothetical protein [Prolixibacteraceae bacterium]HCR90741.1 hypothetical protein [Prolixibacteraceae bacterium]